MELKELLANTKSNTHVWISVFKKNLYRGDAGRLLTMNKDFLSSKVINISSSDNTMYIDIEDSDSTRDLLVNAVLEDGFLKEYLNYYGPKSDVFKEDLIPTIKLLLSRIRGEP